jgi:hypothetical protein
MHQEVILMGKRLLIGLACIAAVVFSSQVVLAAKIGETLTSKEVRTLLSNRTFLVTQVSRVERGKDDYHCYFFPEGKLQVNYTPRHRKTGKWEVGSGGILCVTYTKRGGSRDKRVTRCGVLIKRGSNSYDRINDKGKHTATITSVANGNKFPKK